ncbi:MAG: hypothetical protein IPJ89_04325 [Candidatus Iainarchaeum archaeon]|uniref:Uncharacterized protein n=1 Tax=Candidatus Iainarchaeum sp. TaxID=3101447 RepID=A0A7T9DJ95_9ARCH|nr:MAG: hypothetical protein IPJ89_04325 [Candidatus Diapherotrites archaeon]
MTADGAVSSPKKTVLVLLLEDIFFPGTVNAAIDSARVEQFLKSLQKYAKSNPGFSYYGISALKVGVCQKKIAEAGLEKFFTEENTLAVDNDFIHQMTEIDRELYEKKCKEDESCKDEYARQVQLLDLMKKKNLAPEKVLFVGHDYWFDGFYTRRFSKVDTAFIESALSSKGHLATERVEGLWHIGLVWDELLPLLEGKAPAIDYKRLDEFVVTTISKELFGGQGFSLQKKVIDLRAVKEKMHAETDAGKKESKE